MPSKKENQESKEQIFCVFVNENDEEDDYAELELEGLIEAAGAEVCGSARQRVARPRSATYVGKGKVEEIKEAAAEVSSDLVCFDCELSGVQIRNLEEVIGKPVIDRTQLILDIFARRAWTKEGQLQVELAQYSYRLPRLMSFYTKFERQRGGIGMRGPGETKLESDRRMVRDRIAKLTKEIATVKQHRELLREGRKSQPYPVVAIVGYTSAGKSTLMNRLSSAGVLVDAMPFATLDPTTRLVDLPDGYKFFVTDTVGFIRNLPTLLVAAFRATLEELLHADVLMHVIDVSNPDWEMQHEAVLETIEVLGAQDIPVLTVFNKIDIASDAEGVRRLAVEWPHSVSISALSGEGVDEMLQLVKTMLSGKLGRVTALVPYDQASLVEKAYDFGTIITKEYRDDGIYLVADVVDEMRGRLEKYAVQ
ncbi:GTPase HflX [Kamptonema cortianum]|nr:GTPase HflX [Geitlerinema splendidum]MDK3157652.1 GTPase HflX [Kamptonema cortianum]